MLSNSTILMASKNCTWKEIAGNIIILQSDARPPVTHELNDTGSFIWSCLQKEHLNFNALINAVVEEFDVVPEVAKRDLFLLINDLEKKNLLCTKD